MSGSGDAPSSGKPAQPESGAARVSDAPTSNGFRARLDGLNLFDLVQLECLSRSKRIVRVASAGRVGYLYFRDGEIVHAGTRNLVGERAAVEIMGWNDGVFEVCNIAWPERTTITTRWQQILLAAAKARDDASGKLVRLPSRRSPPASGDSVDGSDETAADLGASVKTDSVQPSSLQQAVRIDAAGQVLSIVGDDGEFGGMVAYASRLAGLIGEALGLEQWKALDVGLESSRCVMYVEEKGSVVGVRAKSDVDLGSVVRKAGL